MQPSLSAVAAGLLEVVVLALVVVGGGGEVALPHNSARSDK